MTTLTAKALTIDEDRLDVIRERQQANKAKGAAANAPPAKPPVVKKPEQNGVAPYRDGTVGAKVWAVAMKLTEGKTLVPVADIITACEKQKIKAGSARAGYATFRKYHGLTA